MLHLCCCARAFSSSNEQGLLYIVVCELLIAVASLDAEQGSSHMNSVVVVLQLGCFSACEIFLDQRSNLSPLYYQADS